MSRLHLEFGGLMTLTAIVAISFSLPAAGDTPAGAAPAANIAMTQPVEAASPSAGPATRIIRRHSDGLFYVEGEANGHLIRFVVDTGATVVVLNRADAEKLGIPFESLASKASMRTVGGNSDMRWAKIDRLDMAGKRIEKINAAVVDGGLPVSLMGQNALELLGTVTLRGDTMTIHD
ncbi:retropepsin-like aspartic protease family protein [Sphingobium nicotianae]|uniref:TIGR02281 family clan AA aspartic protease n=1 Tax=Sphingobium nicotianae TaxID=2782607 RepID=A0A9X1D988_9SPHN|nr:retropepsin-like aspartic protease [Sphingobium nicotianae]MBT2185358.1 TIGR02281 family clan AA aspartic protease [Sphingobium nicotianae]